MRQIRFCLFLLAFFCATSFAQSPANFVNPFIGTDNDGETNPGAVLPWGMMNVAPFNGYDTLQTDKLNQRFGESTYRKTQRYITGFTHGGLSGSGCPALGVLAIMPTKTVLNAFHPKKYLTPFSKELAVPGYYKVHLDNTNITVELTATKRCAMHRYTFPKGKHSILINLGLCLTPTKGGMIQQVSETEFEGYHTVGNFCGRLVTGNLYFFVKIQKQPKLWGMWNDQKNYKQFLRENVGDDAGAYLNFETSEKETITVKVGVSYTSIANAKLNLNAEMPDWNFDKIKLAAYDEWNNQLERIKVDGGTVDDKTIFYTGLYHALLHPNILNDVNGEYPSMTTHTTTKAAGYDRYTIFSLWDTYRTLHPFLALVYPERQLDMVKSMLAIYKEGGWLPKWEITSQETYVMVGDPAIPVIADSYLRGVKQFDVDMAYQAMLKGATTPENNNPLRPGIDSIAKYGFIPQGSKGVWGPVSTTQEYAIADWNLAQFAKAIGKNDDYEKFLKQSYIYRNYFDSETYFFRPRMVDGSFMTDFSPTITGKSFYPGNPGYCEGDAWQYLFFTPHDTEWLKMKLGGQKPFVEKLQTFFDKSYFIMANEPDIATPYLFNYAKGEEWRTQKTVRETIRNNFNNSPAGLPGNDDCGVMSTWLMYSMMGFYPTCPGDMNYQLSSPVFDKVTIKLNPQFYSGKEFVITTKNQSDKSIYIKAMQLNGKPLKRFSINHAEIVKGGALNFDLKSTK